MVSLDASNITLEDAIQATEFMSMRELPKHVHVGPMSPGSVLLTDLPRKDLGSKLEQPQAWLDVVLDIPTEALDMDSIRAAIRDKAWQELPDFMQWKEQPVFECSCQSFFLPQSDGKSCMLKHIYTCSEKVKGSQAMRLLQGL